MDFLRFVFMKYVLLNSWNVLKKLGRMLMNIFLKINYELHISS